MKFNEKIQNYKLFKTAFDIAKSSYSYFLPVIIYFTVIILIIMFLGNKLNIFNFEYLTELQKTNISYEVLSQILIKIVKLYSFLFVFAFLDFLYTVLISEKTYNILTGEKQKNIFNIQNLFQIFFTYILMSIFLLLGYILFIIPGIFLSFYLIFLPHVIAINRQFYFRSIDKSFFIIKSNFTETVLLTLIITIFSIFVSNTITFIFSIFKITNQYAVELTPVFFTQIFIKPFGSILLSLKYINLSQIKGENLLQESINNFQNEETDERNNFSN